jgi:potassium channel subfamily K, other eukaryote
MGLQPYIRCPPVAGFVRAFPLERLSGCRPTAALDQGRQLNSLVPLQQAMHCTAGLRRRNQLVSCANPSPAQSQSRSSDTSSASIVADDPLPSNIRGPLIAIPALLGFAALVLAKIEGWTLLNALYFATVVATTVGYGDVFPVTTAGKLFVCVYALLSVALVGGLLSRLVDRFALAQREVGRQLRQKLLTPHISNHENIDASEPELVRQAKKSCSDGYSRLFATAVIVGVVAVAGACVYGLLLQHMSVVDIIWLTVMTVTTVGLGDRAPITAGGRAFAVVWLIVLAIGFTNLISQHAEVRAMQREVELTKRLMSRSMGDRMFMAIDTSNDGLISQEEYIVYMLCKLGKTSAAEVASIRARFQELDSDNSGTVSRVEVMK